MSRVPHGPDNPPLKPDSSALKQASVLGVHGQARLLAHYRTMLTGCPHSQAEHWHTLSRSETGTRSSLKAV
eukprot:12656276-Alexandrium_andersonii.AAC.1